MQIGELEAEVSVHEAVPLVLHSIISQRMLCIQRSLYVLARNTDCFCALKLSMAKKKKDHLMNDVCVFLLAGSTLQPSSSTSRTELGRDGREVEGLGK